MIYVFLVCLCLGLVCHFLLFVLRALVTAYRYVREELFLYYSTSGVWCVTTERKNMEAANQQILRVAAQRWDIVVDDPQFDVHTDSDN